MRDVLFVLAILSAAGCSTTAGTVDGDHTLAGTTTSDETDTTTDGGGSDTSGDTAASGDTTSGDDTTTTTGDSAGGDTTGGDATGGDDTTTTTGDSTGGDTTGGDATGGDDGGELNLDCWVPEGAESAIDCATVCAAIAVCDPAEDGDAQGQIDDCVGACDVLGPYVSEASAASIETCIVEHECDYTGGGGAIYAACTAELAEASVLVASEASLAACSAINDALDGCDSAEAFDKQCSLMATNFSDEAMAEMAACAEVTGCDAVAECLAAANCLLVNF